MGVSQTVGLSNLQKSSTACFDCFSMQPTEINCIQRTDTLNVQGRTSASLGSSKPCSAIPSFSFVDLQDALELLPELWWSFQTRSCPGHPVHTAVVSLWTLHQQGTGMWECDQPLATTTPRNPLVWMVAMKDLLKYLLQWIWIDLMWYSFTPMCVWSLGTWFRATKSLGWLGIWKSDMVLECTQLLYGHHPFFLLIFFSDGRERHTSIHKGSI